MELEHLFNFSSKLKDCSLKHIGELSFDISESFKCIGIPTTTKESDELLLVDSDADHSYLYVKILSYICNLHKLCKSVSS